MHFICWYDFSICLINFFFHSKFLEIWCFPWLHCYILLKILTFFSQHLNFCWIDLFTKLTELDHRGTFWSAIYNCNIYIFNIFPCKSFDKFAPLISRISRFWCFSFWNSKFYQYWLKLGAEVATIETCRMFFSKWSELWFFDPIILKDLKPWISWLPKIGIRSTPGVACIMFTSPF